MHDERGFTLLEVLVAFIIAGLALAALTQGASGGLQSTRVAAHYQEALSRARSHLAGLGAGLQPGQQQGDDGGGFTWQVVVQPLATASRGQAGEATSRAGRAMLYAVAAKVSWTMNGHNHSVALSTQRLGLAPPEPP